LFPCQLLFIFNQQKKYMFQPMSRCSSSDGYDTTTPESILSKINLDGTKNTITFSIYMGPDPVSTSTVRGVLVWVDDIYIKKHSHPFGENLIVDGSVENSSNDDFKATPSEKCSWYSEAATAMSNCDPLRITTGANGEVKNDPTLRHIDGEPIIHSGTGTYYPDAGISSTERKSGNNAITLRLPAFENEVGCVEYPVDPNTSVIGASTDIDFTDMFPCSSYLSSPLNFTSLPCTSIAQVFDNGERFLITTDYTLCGNLTLKGCQIALESGVKIIVPNGKTLTIDSEGTVNSHLFACDEMWSGIIVEAGGNLIIDGNKNNEKIGTLIEHAETAVTNQNAASMKISFATFNHNKTAIEMIPGTYNTANNFIYGTHFLCSNWQMTKGPLEGQFPEQHVLMNGVTGDMQIGSTANPSSAYTNKFSNALYGINLNESNLNLANTDFEDIYNRDMDSHVVDHGSAIQISNQTTSYDVTIGDADLNYGNSFKNVNRGVTFNNYMSNGNVKIFNCVFDNSDYNYRNSGGEFQNTAITIQSPNVVTGRTTEVFGNGITDFRIGIHAANIENMIVGSYNAISGAPIYNTISYHLGNGSDVSRKHTGIWLQTCANASVKENEITNDEPITENPDLIRGIAVDNSTDLTICGNQITKLGYAMQFEGDCLNSQLKNNIMDTYEIGINYVLGKFSPQGASGASWANEWIHMDQAKMKVDGEMNPPTPFNWYHQDLASNAGNTFRLFPFSSAVVDDDDDEANLPTICKDELIVGGGMDRDADYGPVVADTINYPFFQDEARYLARAALFKRLSDYPALLTISSPLDSAFQAFYDSTVTGSIGILDSVSRSIGLSDFSSAADANAAVDDENSMETNTKLINHLLIHKVALDSVLSSSDTTSLEYIFNQHWIEGGRSVYTAAPLLFKEYYTSSIALRTTASPVEPLAQTNPGPLPELGIYPNPTGEMINFTRILPSGAVVKVFDTSGREMLHEVNPAQINVSSLENGYYILKIFENHELIFHKNIVIIK
jgi:hypothetical protein